MISLKQCRGCEEDFYNSDRGQNGRCWMHESGTMKTRFRTGTWTMPASKGAFTEVVVPSCYRQKGQHYSDSVPNFVKAEDIIRSNRA